MPGAAFEWQPLVAPPAAIRDPDGDGLELKIESRTIPEKNYGTYAMGQVTTIVAGTTANHQNVLLATDEPSKNL